MKDRIARQLIKKIIAKIKELQQEVTAIRHPHPKNCQCHICSAYSVDHLDSLSMEEESALDGVA